MEVLDAIKKRWSVRKYTQEPVPEDVLNRVLEAGRISPSAMNYQPWHFVVVRDRKARERLTDGRYAKFLSDTPVVIVGCGDKRKSSEWYQVDVTIALQNMVTQATAEGLGTCWIGSFYEDKVKAALDIPDDFAVVAMIAMGYPSQPAQRARKAKPLEEISSFDKFSRQ